MSDIDLYFDLCKREKALQKKRDYAREYAKTYEYADPEARKVAYREWYYAKKKRENPMYKVRNYKKKLDFFKGEKTIKTTFTEGNYVVSFD
tara:strand:- start:4623 stop:4895 length:273 start_codon:yes stop_codon:yes gene_type:complete